MLIEPHRNENPKTIFNPLLQDFTTQMADDDGTIHIYTLHALETEEYPTYVANHIVKKLAEHVYITRYASRTTKESVMPGILKEIEG